MKPPARRDNRVPEILQLYTEVREAWRTTLPKAMRIGELLLEQKAELHHGEWKPWLEKYMPFSERTAQEYMRFYRRRDELKSALDADIRQARALLTVTPKSASGAVLTARPVRVRDVRAELARPARAVALWTSSDARAIEQLERKPFVVRLSAAARILFRF